MIVAELRMIPMGEGTSMHEPMEHVSRVLEGCRVDFEIGPLGTMIEAEKLEDVLDAVKACHRAMREDSDRIITEVAIDERLDKEETKESLKQV